MPEPAPSDEHAGSRSNERSLPPGNYLIEIATSAPITTSDLEDGLDLMGWSNGESGPPIVEQDTDRLAHRFVGAWRSGQRLDLVDTSSVRWSFALRLPFEPFARVSKKIRPFLLLTGRRYAFRFLARMKAQPTLRDVEKAMIGMGFAEPRVGLVRRHTHVEGRPDVSCAIWCGDARWTGPRAVHTSEDPVSIEDAILLEEKV